MSPSSSPLRRLGRFALFLVALLLVAGLTAVVAGCSGDGGAADGDEELASSEGDELASGLACPAACANAACGANGCVGACGSCSDGAACTSTGTCVAAPTATPTTRFDVTTFLGPAGSECGAVTPTDDRGHRKCFRQKEFNALDTSGKPHFMAVVTEMHRGDIWQAGNREAAYIDQMNVGWPTGKGGAAAADASYAMLKTNFPHGVPDWILCNEISTSLWQANAEYRKYVVAYAARLHDRWGKQVMVASPFAAPQSNSEDWQALAEVAIVAAEIQMKGSAVVADPATPRRMMQASLDAYAARGVPKGHVFVVDNFANTLPGAAFGRAGASRDGWEKAIVAKVQAANALNIAGYISYAWANNDGETDADTRAAWEQLYGRSLR